MSKIAVQFRKMSKTLYIMPRLKHCRHCGNYSVLWSDQCLNCSKTNRFMPMAQLSKTSASLSRQRDFLIVGMLSLAGLVLADSLPGIFLSVAAGLVATVMVTWLWRRYRLGLENHHARRIVDKEIAAIERGIQLDIEDAFNNEKNGNVKEAYEKLREVGLFIRDEQIKATKLAYLKRFTLRKDMELELSALIPRHYSQDFMDYLKQVSRLSPQLIRSEVFEYVIRYQDQIRAAEGGDELLLAIAGAALRMKKYLKDYHAFILPYTERFNRDHMLRLCHLLQDDDQQLLVLKNKALSLAQLHYHYDPEFQPFLAGGHSR